METPLGEHPEKTINEILDKCKISGARGTILEKRTAIDTCFCKSTVEEIQEALTRYPDAWTYTLASALLTKSPTSLKVTLRQLHIGENLNFDESMKLEGYLTSTFIEGHDFFEGIRAAIIDKDYKPKWKPAKLEEVTNEDIEKYFNLMAKILTNSTS